MAYRIVTVFEFGGGEISSMDEYVFPQYDAAPLVNFRGALAAAVGAR